MYHTRSARDLERNGAIETYTLVYRPSRPARADYDETRGLEVRWLLRCVFCVVDQAQAQGRRETISHLLDWRPRFRKGSLMSVIAYQI